MNLEDIKNAEDNIESLFSLRDELISSSPMLVDMRSRLQWYKKAIQEIPSEAENFFSLIDEPVRSILAINPSNLDYSSVTGATGSFYSVSADTRQIITSQGSQHYPLINEYENLKNIDILLEETIKTILEFRENLRVYKPEKLLNDAKNAYSQWKAGAIDNSDLAAEIRAFQDVFKGSLRDAWVSVSNLKPQAFSWNKMSETIGKKKGGFVNTLISSKRSEDFYHDEFSEILKKIKEVSKEEMNNLFSGYVEHLYSIINLIEIDLMK